MEDPNILEFASKFAEQHNVWISFTIRPSGCDVHMGKNKFLDTITIPKEKLETMGRDDISEVLWHLSIRLNSKVELMDKWYYEKEEN